MSAWDSILPLLEGFGFSPDTDRTEVWFKNISTQPEVRRSQVVEMHHVVLPPHIETAVFHSDIAVVDSSLAIDIIGRWRSGVGGLVYTPKGDNVGILSLTAHVPLAPFDVTDHLALVDFITVFAQTADKLEEIVGQGPDIF